MGTSKVTSGTSKRAEKGKHGKRMIFLKEKEKNWGGPIPNLHKHSKYWYPSWGIEFQSCVCAQIQTDGRNT